MGRGLLLAGLFARAGSSAFGGGNVTTAELHRELVTRRSLLDESKFKLCYTLARVTPGTNSLAFCAGAGFSVLGWQGALIALLSISLPSAAIVVLLTYLYESWSTFPLVTTVMRGILAASIGIIAAGAYELMRPTWDSDQRVRLSLFVTGAGILNALLLLSPLQVLALAAVAGALMPQRQRP